MTQNASETETLYLVDGSSYLYRAFHGLPQLTNSSGEPTGAILGVANMLQPRMIREDDPQKHGRGIRCARTDISGTRLFEDYKATRPPMPGRAAQPGGTHPWIL